MSNQESKSKKELSDKELQQAAGGENIDGRTIQSAAADAATTPTGWTDEEGVFHEGAGPGATTTTTDPGMVPPFSDGSGKPY